LGGEADVSGRPEGLRYASGAADGRPHDRHRPAGADGDGHLRWLKPLPLWTGILAGPIAWAVDLTACYALAKWTCFSHREAVLHAITLAALVVVAIGATVSYLALQRTTGDVPTDGGDPRQRARFMAMLGLGSCALFAVQIVAAAIPQWVLDACQ
jgi:hypothetical protein